MPNRGAFKTSSKQSGCGLSGFMPNYGGSGSAVIKIPTTAKLGDLLIAFVGADYATSGSIPATGWVFIGRTTNGWHTGALLIKTCTPSDIGLSVAVGMTGSEPWDTLCISYSGGLFMGGSVNSTDAGSSISTSLYAVHSSRLTTFMFGSIRNSGGVLSINRGDMFSLLAFPTSPALRTLVKTQDLYTIGSTSYTFSSTAGSNGLSIGVVNIMDRPS